MTRLRRGWIFLMALLVAVMVPATGEGTGKRLYKADISVNSTGVGSSVITERTSGYDYIARTHAQPNFAVTRVSLVPTDATWEVVLCENGGIAGDCTYNSSGNLDIEGGINSTMLGLAGISGGTFVNALRNSRLQILLNGGTHGAGIYVRII